MCRVGIVDGTMKTSGNWRCYLGQRGRYESLEGGLGTLECQALFTACKVNVLSGNGTHLKSNHDEAVTLIITDRPTYKCFQF